MIKAIIIDDETNCIEMLDWLIKTYCPGIEIMAQCSSAEEGIKAIKKHSPDVIFLDIEMPKMNGFDLLQQLTPVNFEVIFTTAYDKFAIKAFKFSAMDYLLKPIDADDLKNAVIRLETKLQSAKPDAGIEALLNNIKSIHQPLNKIAIPTQEGLVFTIIKDIIRCESDSNYTTFFLSGDKQIVSSKSMKEYEELLEEYNFFRVHNSHLINLNHLEKYVKGDGGYVVMSDKCTVPVSRSRKEDFINHLS